MELGIPRCVKDFMKQTLSVLIFFLFITGCSTPDVMAFFATQTPTPTITPTPTATFTVSPTPTLTLTPTVTPTLFPTATATPKWAVKGPGKITCPILLYHHIKTPDVPNEYFVTPEDFRAQMQALKDWGYTTIPISLLITAINDGAPMPEKPIVISFDDGDISVYNTAYPIMKEFGFVGVNYLVGNRLESDGFMNVAQIKELMAAGWEVGSHSMTHIDLTQSPDISWELTQSKADLKEALGVKILSFAYPFGSKSDDIINKVSKVYIAGVGLGVYVEQGLDNIYYLWRRPVPYGIDMATFASYLPGSLPPGQ